MNTMHTLNASRRQVIKSAGQHNGAGAGAGRPLPASAADLARLYRTAIGAGCPALTFLLGPELTRTRTAALPCVDVHTHFFNARDVPVRAFPQKSVRHDMPSVIQMLLALFILAPAIEAVAQDMASPAAEESRELQEIRQRFAGMAPAEATVRLDAEAYARASEVGKALFRETRRRAPKAIALFDSLEREAEPAVVDRA